ncbi:MAG: hypothetical protein V7L20_14410 [Nostoc sp.]|uniref:hypothetical protein n=1 Tax=Nostoc sp. TaxID=1180 RepID=UPI002FF83D50
MQSLIFPDFKPSLTEKGVEILLIAFVFCVSTPFNPPLAGRGVETWQHGHSHPTNSSFNPPLAGRGVETLRFKPLIYQ